MATAARVVHERGMRVHHLNCISTCPLGGRLMDGRTRGLLRRGELSCHCLLIETNVGLILVDTGFGLRDVRDPKSRLSRFFLGLVSPDFREELTAVRQIARLRLDPRDVRHIVLTHLDFDHAGGLDDFPDATVHLLATERDAATAQRTWLDRQRYRPQQWSTRQHWLAHDARGGEQWQGLDCLQPIPGVEIALVPLIGHTLGHAGVAVRLERHWLLDAGDAYFHCTEMDTERPRCTPGLRFYQWMMEKDRAQRLHNQQRLRDLVRTRSAEVEIFCSHDMAEFERFGGVTPAQPSAYAPAH
jgi:glyoxylase-like metal-dependent hydrolase (beta-lactamase superfamily II)